MYCGHAGTRGMSRLEHDRLTVHVVLLCISERKTEYALTAELKYLGFPTSREPHQVAENDLGGQCVAILDRLHGAINPILRVPVLN
jgi:hypothetical protein